MLKDVRGQYTLEYLIVMVFFFIIISSFAYFTGEASEMNQVMVAARSGATEGGMVDSLGIYPNEAFSDYIDKHTRLLSPSSVKIVKIEYTNQGFNTTYNRTKIQLKIFASAPTITKPEDKDSLGDRINFYVRKSISRTFKTQNLTNAVFNPAFSDRYVVTTGDVNWVD
jgi:hypothetical protein